MNSEKRNDTYSSVLSGLGGKGDKTQDISLTYGECDLLQDQTLSSYYSLAGIVTSIVDNVPNDGVRNGWTYKNDDDKSIETYCDKILNLSNNVNYAWKMARVFGGAIIVMFSDKDIEKPLGINEQIKHLKVYSRARIQTQQTDIVDNPKSPYFDDVENFTVNTRSGKTIYPHRSRCLVFKGESIADFGDNAYSDFKFRYWGLSTVQKIWNEVKVLGASMQGIASVMQELILGKYTVDGLRSILSQNKREALEKIMTRVEVMNYTKSNINAVLLGENEKYERDTANFSGTADIIDRMMMMVSAVAQQPVTKIFGRSAAGMNATGENDLQQYYDDVASFQEKTLRHELDKVISQVGASLNPGKNKEEFGIDEFESLWEMTEKEKAEIDKMKAETNQIYIQNMVVSPDYIQEKEFPDMTEMSFSGEEELEGE